MLRGEKVLLRARVESDVAVLHAEIYDDVASRARADTRPWRPLSPDSVLAPFAMADPTEDFVAFSGAAVLHGMELHSRSAHIGISLRPAFRGRGLAADTVRVLCEYGFTIRGLHRLAIETLSDNEPMLRAAEKVGFVREGVLRRAAWVSGEYLDEILFGMLAEEWAEHRARGPGADRLDELVDEAGRESFPASDPTAF
jgi:RimJ/RimL family protein N-acetyltransferase